MLRISYLYINYCLSEIQNSNNILFILKYLVSLFRDLVARGHQLLHEVAAVVLVVNIGATMD